MRVTVHIGMQKTGSTAVQQYLDVNRDVLAGRGLLFPRALGQRNQQLLPIIAHGSDEISAIHRRMRMTEPDEVRQRVAKATRRTRRLISRFKPEHMVLSSEQLSSEARSPQRIARFAAWVRQFDEQPRIVVYLRRQDLWFVSRYSMAIMHGSTDPLVVPDPAHTGTGSIYDYRTMIDRWAAEFGSEQVTVRVFERGQLVNGDAATDFLHTLGRPDLAGLDHPGSPNTKLDADVLEFVRRLNQHIPRFVDGTLNPRRLNLEVAIDQLPGSGLSWGLPQSQARAFQDRFAADNAAIARESLGRADGELFSTSFADHQLPDPSVLTQDRSVELAAHLWGVASDARRLAEQERRAAVLDLREQQPAAQPE